MVNLLLDHQKTDIWARDFGYLGMTVAHYAVEKSYVAILKKLLAHEPHLVHAVDQRKWTLLHRVQGHLEIARILLDVSADINALDLGH